MTQFNPDEKLLSIRDFAICAAKQENPWIAGVIAQALDLLLGKEAGVLMLNLERDEIDKIYATKPTLVDVMLKLYPSYTREQLEEWRAKRLPSELASIRRIPQYKAAEAELLQEKGND